MRKINYPYEGVHYAHTRDLLDKVTEALGDKPAFRVKIQASETPSYEDISFETFRMDVRALTVSLLNRGFQGKRIAVIGPNSYWWGVAYLSALNGVGVCVPLDKGLPLEEIENSLIISQAEVIFFDEEYQSIMDEIIDKKCTKLNLLVKMKKSRQAEGLSGSSYSSGPAEAAPPAKESEVGGVARADLGSLMAEGLRLIEAGDRRWALTPIDPEEVCLLLFTSGTTSMAKAVLLCQNNLVSNIHGVTRTIYADHRDTYIALLPYHHTLGAIGMLVVIGFGACTVFADGLKYIAKNLVEYRVTVFIGVPLLIEAIYKKIWAQAEKQGKAKKLRTGLKLSGALMKIGVDKRRKIFKEIIDQLGGGLRLVVSGASALDPNVVEGLNKLGIDTVQGYGLTETSPILTLEGGGKLSRKGSVGPPLCNVEIKIDAPDETGIGEVLARGPNIMLGYYENEAETNKVLVDGWFHTGDLGYLDNDEFLYICGRKRNMIVLKSGKKVFPEEVETLINSLPFVEESMVYPIEKGDDVVVGAKIVYNKEYMAEQVGVSGQENIETYVKEQIDGINEQMPTYKSIRRLVITDLPTIKTTTAKIKRYEEMKVLRD